MSGEPLRLPKSLEPLRTPLQTALAGVLIGEWPESEKFRRAEQPEAIGTVLIGKLHEHLLPARIAYVFKKEMKRGAWQRLGTAKRAAALLVFLAEVDFVLTFNWTAWRTLQPHQRIALVDHELCHCGIDHETGKYTIVHHDLEEFGVIVRRWGQWKPDLDAFADALAEQPDLFPKAKASKEPSV